MAPHEGKGQGTRSGGKGRGSGKGRNREPCLVTNASTSNNGIWTASEVEANLSKNFSGQAVWTADEVEKWICKPGPAEQFSRSRGAPGTSQQACILQSRAEVMASNKPQRPPKQAHGHAYSAAARQVFRTPSPHRSKEAPRRSPSPRRTQETPKRKEPMMESPEKKEPAPMGKAKEDIAAELEIVFSSGSLLRRSDVDGRARQCLHAVHGVGGRVKVRECLQEVLYSTLQKERQDVSNWTAYVSRLVRKFFDKLSSDADDEKRRVRAWSDARGNFQSMWPATPTMGSVSSWQPATPMSSWSMPPTPSSAPPTQPPTPLPWASMPVDMRSCGGPPTAPPPFPAWVSTPVG